jgi:hypothetical protein
MSTPPPPTDPADPDEERAASRADSVPEETEAGADDPRRQAEAVLADSDERLEDPSGTRNESTQTPGEE